MISRGLTLVLKDVAFRGRKGHFMRYFTKVILMSIVLLAERGWGDDYVTVKVAELKANPQNYWARGIVFTDELSAPAGEETVKLGGKKHYLFQTKTMGACYLDADHLSDLTACSTGSSYVFTGTVYQQDKSWFFSDRRFFVAVNRISPAVNEMDKEVRALRDAFGRASGQYSDTLKTLNEILTDAQAELSAYCAASNIAIKAVFEPDSKLGHIASQAARQAMMRKENETKTPSLEYFVSLLTAMMAVHNGALDPTGSEVQVGSALPQGEFSQEAVPQESVDGVPLIAP